MGGRVIWLVLGLAAVAAAPAVAQTRGGAQPQQQQPSNPDPEAARDLLRQTAPRDWERPSPAPGQRTPLPTDEERAAPPAPRQRSFSPPLRPVPDRPFSGGEAAPGGVGETPDQEPVARPRAAPVATAAPAERRQPEAEIPDAPGVEPKAEAPEEASPVVPVPPSGPVAAELVPPLATPDRAAVVGSPVWVLALVGMGLFLLLVIAAWLVRRLMAPPPAATVEARVSAVAPLAEAPVFDLPDTAQIGLAVRAASPSAEIAYPATLEGTP